MKTLEKTVVRLKQYEEKHPFMTIVVTAGITILIVAAIAGVIKIKEHSFYSTNDNVEFEDDNFKKAMQRYFEKENITLTDLENITILTIENDNTLENIQDIVKCKNLTTVKIKGCHLSDVSILGELDRLKEVDLSSNLIYSTKGIEKSVTIEKLNLSRNRISDISNLCEISTLKELDVSTNNIGILPKEIKNLNSLTILNVAGNRLISINEITGLLKLQELHANSNKLTESPALKNLPDLCKLWLGGNAFIELETVGNLGSSLKELYVGNNYLSDLEFVKDYPLLEKLDISYNQYTTLEGLSECENLQSLDMRGTQIEDVSAVKLLPMFNSIYVDEDFDRSQLDFMIGKFRNADRTTKKYLLEKEYGVE